MADSPDMAPNPDATTTFSHEATLAAITRYYQVIERLHGPGTVKYPPEGGWPQIIPDHAQHFNLGPEAFRLVKELPYCDPNIVPECRPRSYPREFEPPLPPRRYEGEGDSDGNPDFPPHIFPLAEGGYRWGSTLIIDTKRGVAVWHNENEDSQLNPWPEPDAASEIDFDPDPEAHEPIHTPRGWRSAPTYRIETFFAMAEEKLKTLHWIPLLTEGDDPIADPKRELDEEQKARIKILRDAGWPGDSWDYMRAYRATEDWKKARHKLEKAEDLMRKATLEANL